MSALHLCVTWVLWSYLVIFTEWFIRRHLIINCFYVTLVWCAAHQDRVTCVQFSPVHEFVLSCSRDKYFEWHCAQTGRRLGGYLASAWTTCLQYLSSLITVCLLSKWSGCVVSLFCLVVVSLVSFGIFRWLHCIEKQLCFQNDLLCITSAVDPRQMS